MPNHPSAAADAEAVEFAAFAIERERDLVAPDVVIAARAQDLIRTSNAEAIIRKRDTILFRAQEEIALCIEGAQDAHRRQLESEAATAKDGARAGFVKLRGARPDLYAPPLERGQRAIESALPIVGRSRPHLVAHLPTLRNRSVPPAAASSATRPRATASSHSPPPTPPMFPADLQGRSVAQWMHGLRKAYRIHPAAKLDLSLAKSQRDRELLTAALHEALFG